jgi:hypothetical protein
MTWIENNRRQHGEQPEMTDGKTQGTHYPIPKTASASWRILSAMVHDDAMCQVYTKFADKAAAIVRSQGCMPPICPATLLPFHSHNQRRVVCTSHNGLLPMPMSEELIAHIANRTPSSTRPYDNPRLYGRTWISSPTRQRPHPISRRSSMPP